MSTYFKLKTRLIITLGIFCLGSQNVLAAFCSLRDPASAIQTFYPDSTSYRSIVKTIKQSTRSRLKQTLPIDLHFNEFGRHTVYVAFKDMLPIALLHSRSEASEWGLMEFSWAMNTDFEIEDFYFQRCRSTLCNDKSKSVIRDALFGKSLNDLQNPSLADHINRNLSATQKGKNTKEFTAAVIQSAQKTLALTEIEWKSDLDILYAEYLSKLSRNILNSNTTPKIVELNNNQHIATALKDIDHIDHDSLQVFSVIQDREKARIVSARWKIDSKKGRVLFVFDSEGTQLYFEDLSNSLDSQSHDSFKSKLHRKVPNAEECADLSDLTTLALFKAAYPKHEDKPI